jgi:hypothetical protein
MAQQRVGGCHPRIGVLAHDTIGSLVPPEQDEILAVATHRRIVAVVREA